ncbi:MAG: hypothetical protein E7351_02300 [Clostridiales bacterium]|nr:hypothetical protein [Clostridiales bacterium]
MNEKGKKSGIKWLEKLKNVKHIEIYVAVIFIVILLLIYLSNFHSDKSDTSKTTTNELTVLQYVDDLEQNLEDILSNIGGVTNVKVMITLDMDQAEVLDSRITLSTFPSVKGVLVTAKGVEIASTKLKVLHAVEAVLDITNGNIEILSSE